MPVARRTFLICIAGAPLGGCGGGRAEPALEPAPKPEPEPAVVEPDPPVTTLDHHVAQLRERFADRGWTAIAEPPFAVIGDGTALEVQHHAASTIRWAVRHLEAAYFELPPDPIVTIWLFETDRSYARYAKELFGDPPDTPYGYYSPSDRALVMNIGTGGGTLVHEIVHPYIATNFPTCPDWFNEGLASLYEQSSERDGAIIGLTNWRLAGLQAALRAGTVPSFQALCASGPGFYTADPGSNYAQARYLCYWLQEQGLLRGYYERFRAQAKADPTGYATLVELVGPDMVGFRRRWEAFVLGLVYR